MTVSAFSYYRGGTAEQVMPLSRDLKARYAAYGITYRLGKVLTGPHEGDWQVVVTYADDAALEAAGVAFAEDPEVQRIFVAISHVAKRVSRELVEDCDL